MVIKGSTKKKIIINMLCQNVLLFSRVFKIGEKI